MPSKSSYESIIIELYQANEAVRKSLIRSLEGKTRENFEILKGIIEKRFKLAKNLGIQES